MAPTKDPGPDADPLSRLLYEKGRTSKVNYEYDQQDPSYGANVKLGLKVGVGVNISNSSRKVKDAQYLGAPNQGGTRDYKKYQECR
jgi:hypothetical protein